MAAELARGGGALVDLGLTEVAGITGLAGTGEGVLTVDAFAVVAGRRLTVVDVRLAIHSCETLEIIIE